MSNKANLFLVVNLGCEMIYVIDQRLWAQKVAQDKGVKVLTDIAGILLDDKLLNELSDAHYIATHEHVRLLLEDVACASIMSLDTFSMNKLWELMTMIFKWQMTLIQPKEIYLLTKRHLNGVLKLVKEQETIQRVEHAIKLFDKIANDINDEDLVLIKEKLVHWLNDFHTKVSILLRLGLQKPDGSFVTTFSNPNDEAWIVLRNLGNNIYSKHEILPNTEVESPIENSNSHVEVELLVNQILGGKIEHSAKTTTNFIRFTIDKPETSARENDVCNFQTELLCMKDASKIHENIAVISQQEKHLTLEDELLTMLDENMQYGEKL